MTSTMLQLMVHFTLFTLSSERVNAMFRNGEPTKERSDGYFGTNDASEFTADRSNQGIDGYRGLMDW